MQFLPHLINPSLVTVAGSVLSTTVLAEDAISLEVESHTKFSVWVSFCEIYNENIHDLLEAVPSGALRRTALRLSQDVKGNAFVKGLNGRGEFSKCPHRGRSSPSTVKRKDNRINLPYCLFSDLRWVPVNRAEEAYMVMKLGKKNQSFSSTRLNQLSSRRYEGRTHLYRHLTFLAHASFYKANVP